MQARAAASSQVNLYSLSSHSSKSRNVTVTLAPASDDYDIGHRDRDSHGDPPGPCPGRRGGSPADSRCSLQVLGSQTQVEQKIFFAGMSGPEPPRPGTDSLTRAGRPKPRFYQYAHGTPEVTVGPDSIRVPSGRRRLTGSLGSDSDRAAESQAQCRGSHEPESRVFNSHGICPGAGPTPTAVTVTCLCSDRDVPSGGPDSARRRTVTVTITDVDTERREPEPADCSPHSRYLPSLSGAAQGVAPSRPGGARAMPPGRLLRCRFQVANHCATNMQNMHLGLC